jgi:hypothetical protein
MQFRIQIPIPKSNHVIDYNSRIVSLGSCFAENMGEKLGYFKFRNTVNPFGIIFNPVSIEKLLSRAINQVEFTEADIFFHNERWHCFEVHSDVSHANKEVCLAILNEMLQHLHDQLAAATHIILTYGTSWVYRHKASQLVVANCHKVPQVQFDKEILSIDTIAKSIQNTIATIRKVNPNGLVLFTVSPVRHSKDGFVENQRSKAHLISAIHQILNLESQALKYFPSYEIMMDELRDYRFYAEDMLHPSAIAIDYIWERFTETWISESVYAVMEEVNSIQKGLLHKPFHPDSESHKHFSKKLHDKMERLQQQFPHIQF